MIVSRFAPSPSGPLHLGHAFSAVLGHARARAAGGRFLLRIEDLDAARCRPAHIVAIGRDLAWLALTTDPPTLVQSGRARHYLAAMDMLKEQGVVYPCFCTRADIASSLSAPHGASGAAYPGTCRHLPDEPRRRAAFPHSWRLDSAKALALAGLPAWSEEDGRRFVANPADVTDMIVARKDAPASYHLACVVDDASSGVSLVVRGVDLRGSTPVQRLLQELLGLPAPSYLHHPLVTYLDGRRLAKREHAPTLSAMREAGVDGTTLAARLLSLDLPFGFAFAGE